MMQPLATRGSSPAGSILRFVDKIVSGCLIVIMTFMSLAIFVQVLCRVFLGTAIIWAEEFAVLLFAWMIYVGAAYAQKEDSHLSINTLRMAVGPRLGVLLDVFRHAVILVCSATAIWQGVLISRQTVFLRYPAMEISRSFLYASVPVGFGLGLVYLIVNIVGRLQRKED